MTVTNRWPDKDKDDVLDFSIDWTSALDSGDAISSVTWIVPAGLTKDSQSVSGAVATIWLSGGTVDADYTVTCRVVTTGGRTMDRSARLYVTER